MMFRTNKELGRIRRESGDFVPARVKKARSKYQPMTAERLAEIRAKHTDWTAKDNATFAGKFK
jgi:hypothetical protein